MATAPFTTVENFLLDTPLYAPLQASKEQMDELGLLFEGAKFDGHCPYCHRSTTFILKRETNHSHYVQKMELEGSFSRYTFSASCARNHLHSLMVIAWMSNWQLTKIGQWPSLASIANDESKRYRSVLQEQDARELHTSIGLAAHGVGIGSFVYLRRIFERLIWQRFRDFQKAERWNEAEFAKLRMDEKVKFLDGHLPAFLVANRAIYSILSLGVHELTEEECLADFAILKQSVVLILEEDRNKQEQLKQQQEFTKAIQQRQEAVAAKAKPRGRNRMLPDSDGAE